MSVFSFLAIDSNMLFISILSTKGYWNFSITATIKGKRSYNIKTICNTQIFSLKDVCIEQHIESLFIL